MLSPTYREIFWHTDNVIERAHESVAIRTAKTLYDAGSISFHLEDGIIHRSGIRAPLYINVRAAFEKPETRSELSRLIAEHAYTMKRPDVVMGVDLGGIAPAHELANQLFLPFGVIRKQVKGHGQKRQIEGDVRDKHTLIVEDVVNLGTSSLPAVEAVRKEGGVVDSVLAVVTYGFTKTKEQFAAAGVTLHTLTDVPTIVAVGVKLKKIEQSDADNILLWLKEQDKNNENLR